MCILRLAHVLHLRNRNQSNGINPKRGGVAAGLLARPCLCGWRPQAVELCGVGHARRPCYAGAQAGWRSG
eukprot:6794673-Alexandrium_andersonii.AAC.1